MRILKHLKPHTAFFHKYLCMFAYKLAFMMKYFNLQMNVLKELDKIYLNGTNEKKLSKDEAIKQLSKLGLSEKLLS